MITKKFGIGDGFIVKGKYLSDVIDLTKIRKGSLNLIVAPPGSGKTTFAVEKLPCLASNKSRVLYLIDTAVGKDQLLKHNDVQLINSDLYYYMKRDVVPKRLNKTVVMTYAYFGSLVKFNPKFIDDFEVIICDELHNMFWPINMHRNNIFKNYPLLTDEEISELQSKSCSNYISLEEIKKCIVGEKQYIIGITATPKMVLKKLSQFVQKININDELVQYETYDIKRYMNLDLILNRILPNERGIIYIPHINQIKRYTSMLCDRGIRAEGIWSLNNHKHPMTNHQMEIRNYIIQNNNLPDDIDVLFINKSNETSLNIFTKLDYMIVHSSDEDVQVQARGRFRGDLKTLYLLDRSSKVELPTEMLNIRLFKKDVDDFILENNIRDTKGELIRQPAFKKLLTGSGYEITEGRNRKSTYFIAS